MDAVSAFGDGDLVVVVPRVFFESDKECEVFVESAFFLCGEKFFLFR